METSNKFGWRQRKTVTKRLFDRFSSVCFLPRNMSEDRCFLTFTVSAVPLGFSFDRQLLFSSLVAYICNIFKNVLFHYYSDGDPLKTDWRLGATLQGFSMQKKSNSDSDSTTRRLTIFLTSIKPEKSPLKWTPLSDLRRGNGNGLKVSQVGWEIYKNVFRSGKG